RARAQAARRYRGCEAPLACVDCVERAASASLSEGLAYERERVLGLVNGGQAKALRQLLFAERAALKRPARGRAAAPVAGAGAGGAGPRGAGIAMRRANAGLDVVLVERDAEALERGWAVIRRNYAATAAKGRLTADQVAERESRIRRSLAFEALADVDLAIEA